MSRLLYQAELPRQGLEQTYVVLIKFLLLYCEPPTGIEPVTFSLPWKRSTD